MHTDKLPDNGVGVKHKSDAKTSRIPIKIVPMETLKKPDWIKVRLSNSPKYQEVKELLRKNNLHTVCEEASCPNISECFSKGTATFMIMGDICTRRCPFCDVGHGRPNPLDPNEPQKIADAIQLLNLSYVVITSVDRDDLRDGGAKHFTDCIRLIRNQTPNTQIEILVPDFRGRLDKALDILKLHHPDVLNHNLETVPRLYKQNRPGSDYQHSLILLSRFKQLCPNVTTKSGLMVGLGETNEELREVFRDLRQHNVDMLTLGQYLQPSSHHLPVMRYMSLEEFKDMEQYAYSLGFKSVASAPMVRSSYHADIQAHLVTEGLKSDGV